MAELTLKETLDHPDFKGLPVEERRKVLTARFPDFTLLPPLEQNKVLGYKEPSFGEKAGAALRLAGGRAMKGLGSPDVLTGVAKGLYSTAIHSGPGQLAQRFMTPEAQARTEAMTTPRTPGEKVGKFGEQAGEFIAPEAAGLRLAKGARLIPRVAAEAAKTGLISGVQTGSAKEAAKGAALGGGLPIAGKLGSGALHYASELLGLTTGAGGEAIRTAATTAAPVFKEAMRGGKTEIQIAEDVRGAVEQVADARSAKYRGELGRLPQEHPAISNIVNTAKKDLLTNLKTNWDIPVTRRMIPLPTGGSIPGELEVDLSKSVIRHSPEDQQKILNLVTDLDHWDEHTTAGIDRLKRGIDKLYSKDSMTRSIIQKSKKQIRDALNQIPGYQTMTKDYAQATKFLDEFKREFSTKAGTGTLIRKAIPYALNQNNEYRKVMIEALGQAAGIDLKAMLAGRALRPVIPRGLVARGVLTGGEAGLGALKFLGALSGPATAANALMGLYASSPRAVGETMALISVLQRNPLVRGAVQAGAQVGRGAGLVGAQPQPQQ